MAIMNLLTIYLRRIFQQGRTSAKGRIEYESRNQKDAGHGKTGTVCGHHCGAVDDAAGLHPTGRCQGDHHPHPRHLRLDFTRMEGRRRPGRPVWPDQPDRQHPHPVAHLLHLQPLLFAGRGQRQRLEPCYLLCAAHPGGDYPLLSVPGTEKAHQERHRPAGCLRLYRVDGQHPCL